MYCRRLSLQRELSYFYLDCQRLENLSKLSKQAQYIMHNSLRCSNRNSSIYERNQISSAFCSKKDKYLSTVSIIFYSDKNEVLLLIPF